MPVTWPGCHEWKSVTGGKKWKNGKVEDEFWTLVKSVCRCKKEDFLLGAVLVRAIIFRRKIHFLFWFADLKCPQLWTVPPEAASESPDWQWRQQSGGVQSPGPTGSWMSPTLPCGGWCHARPCLWMAMCSSPLISNRWWEASKWRSFTTTRVVVKQSQRKTVKKKIYIKKKSRWSQFFGG